MEPARGEMKKTGNELGPSLHFSLELTSLFGDFLTCCLAGPRLVSSVPAVAESLSCGVLLQEAPAKPAVLPRCRHPGGWRGRGASAVWASVRGRGTHSAAGAWSGGLRETSPPSRSSWQGGESSSKGRVRPERHSESTFPRRSPSLNSIISDELTGLLQLSEGCWTPSPPGAAQPSRWSE